jgi:sugar phosphate isomerase/epimerase
MVYSDQNECIRYIGKRLKATHVHDNDGTWDAHLPPFFGNVCWEPLIMTLKEIGYQGPFSFEVKRLPSYLPENTKMSLWAFTKVLGEHLLSLSPE